MKVFGNLLGFIFGFALFGLIFFVIFNLPNPFHPRVGWGFVLTLIAFLQGGGILIKLALK